MDFVYCHGLPGSPAELQPLVSAERLRSFAALDRLAWRGTSYARGVAAALDSLGITAPVDVVGFSLGAMAALHIAAARPEVLRKLILVSPAAPLELGDFLPAMAGRPVFDAARRGTLALRSLSAAQWTAASLAPNFLIKTMFANTSAAEQDLLDAPAFKNMIADGMRQCLGPRQDAYRAELKAYVTPWSDILARVSCEIEIWQGDQDTWAPIGMARALQAHLPQGTHLRICEGLGHYGTLREALTQRAA